MQRQAPVNIVGFITCGGCPGKRAIPRAKMLVERGGAEAIVFASCISKGNPIGYPCPHYANMRDAVIKQSARILKSSSGRTENGLPSELRHSILTK
ncbi:CGGC domain-containing protein [Methanogenium cariaci]|uniref:CGGC domain-containing protein n=1 Tax=Methanogenium cariaci TaxID=2197 RepID=UPI000A4F53C9|nr:CGGC domain-containing protein [Methanogenium cariaci]